MSKKPQQNNSLNLFYLGKFHLKSQICLNPKFLKKIPSIVLFFLEITQLDPNFLQVAIFKFYCISSYISLSIFFFIIHFYCISAGIYELIHLNYLISRFLIKLFDQLTKNRTLKNPMIKKDFRFFPFTSRYLCIN